jgi:hypothetical protein
VSQAGTGAFEHALDVRECLMRLGGNIARPNQFAVIPHGTLPSEIQRVAVSDAMREIAGWGVKPTNFDGLGKSHSDLLFGSGVCALRSRGIRGGCQPPVSLRALRNPEENRIDLLLHSPALESHTAHVWSAHDRAFFDVLAWDTCTRCDPAVTTQSLFQLGQFRVAD